MLTLYVRECVLRQIVTGFMTGKPINHKGSQEAYFDLSALSAVHLCWNFLCMTWHLYKHELYITVRADSVYECCIIRSWQWTSRFSFKSESDFAEEWEKKLRQIMGWSKGGSPVVLTLTRTLLNLFQLFFVVLRHQWILSKVWKMWRICGFTQSMDMWWNVSDLCFYVKVLGFTKGILATVTVLNLQGNK